MINAQKSMTIKVDALDIAQEEQKVYSNANINDDFAPDSVILVMSNLKSLSCQTYSQSDFPRLV